MPQKNISLIISFLAIALTISLYKSGNYGVSNTIYSVAGFLFICSIFLLFMKRTRKFAVIYISIFIILFISLFSYSYYSGNSVFDLYQASPQQRADEIAEILTKQGLIDNSNKSTSEKATEYVERLKEKGLLVIDEEPKQSTEPEKEESEHETQEEEKTVDQIETAPIVPENYIPTQSKDFLIDYNYASFEIEWSLKNSDAKKILLTLYTDTEDVSRFNWNDDFTRVAFVVLNQNRDIEYPNNTKLFVLDINENGEVTQKEKYNISAFYVCGGNCNVDPVVWLDEKRIGYVSYWNQNEEKENKIVYLKN
jgi:hypothetical protein